MSHQARHKPTALWVDGGSLRIGKANLGKYLAKLYVLNHRFEDIVQRNSLYEGVLVFYKGTPVIYAVARQVGGSLSTLCPMQHEVGCSLPLSSSVLDRIINWGNLEAIETT